jgi:hypothetical protein
MTTNYHHQGDNINVSGQGNIGAIKFQNQGAADPATALREMIGLVTALRGQVAADDRQVLDESVKVVQRGADADKGALRRALSNIVGIATMVGAAGSPVLDAALKVKELFGV